MDTHRWARLVALLAITAIALGVMVASSIRVAIDPRKSTAASVSAAAAPASVAVRRVLPEEVEIYDTYSGMIQPFERYSLAFEVPGRVAQLGATPAGKPLDVGERVARGDLLAELDSTVFRAQRDEAEARLKMAQKELQRVETARQTNPIAVSEAELVRRETELAVAQAQRTMLQKNLDNTSLRAPVSGVISQRFISAGESVNPQQPVFEILEVDRVLLVVGVPESRLTALLRRQNEARRLTASSAARSPFEAAVRLKGRPRRGEPDRRFTGEVFRIAEKSNDDTGVFDVEILLDNPEGALRPGLIGIAQLVTRRVQAFRIPSDAVAFRENRAILYTVDEAAGLSRRYVVPPEDYVEQGHDVIVLRLPPEHRVVVIRGQHRLVDAQPVKIVGDEDQPQELPSL